MAIPQDEKKRLSKGYSPTFTGRMMPNADDGFHAARSIFNNVHGMDAQQDARSATKGVAEVLADMFGASKPNHVPTPGRGGRR